MTLESFSPEDTFRIGRMTGEKALPGQIYTLRGDLGVGKTVFTQGVASGLGSREPVNSPTKSPQESTPKLAQGLARSQFFHQVVIRHTIFIILGIYIHFCMSCFISKHCH